MRNPATEESQSRIAAAAVLVHLTGSRRGTRQRLEGESLQVGAAAGAEVRLAPQPAVAPHHATLGRRGLTYELFAEPGRAVWVNGEAVDHLVLASGDVLRIGEGGPLLRFRLYEGGMPAHKSMAEALSDCAGCARHEGESALGRVGIFLREMPRELATQTAPAVRWGVFALLAVLVAATTTLGVRTLRLEARLEREALRVAGMAELLAEAERKALTPEDLAAARQEVEGRLSDALGRVEALEARAQAGRRVVSEASRSVVFLQGAYGFEERESGRPLRFVGVGRDGRPRADSSGEPLVTLEGEGPPVQAFFFGTAFLAGEGGLLLSNRHVAIPWEDDPVAESLARRDLVPVLQRFLGYLPGVERAFPVAVLSASSRADLAVLGIQGLPEDVRSLPLSEVPPQAGDEVIVLGYPTGVRALLARSDEGFLERLVAGGKLDFWSVPRRLAAEGRIAPLATRGIVGQVTTAAVVYDAETTQGGSGGPVLSLAGEVVAVNAAVLPEFGGSNLGVPVGVARRLLAAARK